MLNYKKVVQLVCTINTDKSSCDGGQTRRFPKNVKLVGLIGKKEVQDEENECLILEYGSKYFFQDLCAEKYIPKRMILLYGGGEQFSQYKNHD